ncbi:putative spermidine/putrescine transport system substrate-binding protein [Palleronia marisminoris]|uniref:Bacterial extracellular solute-binding protein n=1 Tax=Palleronia marisminoris TaxID=315423 RepID=A0A1Y5S9X9_9RHOB|nr:extracellular solute-binding protein [Palleronia marisminoris]SFG69996.1 putative spermidine/putrescine transport system substrate-binding protein [Palleronia marisminoris]SLN35805.1 Bacterial extracellular solute-binding protein [Palleronia marisminoris]
MKLKTTLLASAALCVATGAVAQEQASESPVAGEPMADEMTIVSWGGAYQDSQLKAYVEPYLEMNPDVSVTWDESSAEAVAQLRAMSEANNMTWDLVDVTAADAMRLCDEGLAMEVDIDDLAAPAPDGTPASEDFGDEMLVSDCFIPQIAYSYTFGYRNDVAEWDGETPTEICDIFDTETFPGQRSLEKRPHNNLEWALMCDGVPQDEIYETLETDEGVDRALAKLDEIKDQTVWWTSGADTPQLLADGEIVMGSSYNGRLFSLIVEQDQPVSMMWDAQSYDLDGWIIPEGLSDEEENRVRDFLWFATDTQRLADQAKYISYGPARASSAPMVGEHAELGVDMAPHMPTNPDNASNAFVQNYEWWADYRDDLDSRFQAWLAQ